MRTRVRPRPCHADILDSPFLLIGTHEQMAQALLERRERFGLSYFTVFEPAIDAFAPVVSRLAGG